MDVIYRQESVVSVPWKPLLLPAASFCPVGNRQGGEMELFLLPASSIVYWPEFAGLHEGDVVVSVEYCCGCEDHNTTVWHDENKYKKVCCNADDDNVDDYGTT